MTEVTKIGCPCAALESTEGELAMLYAALDQVGCGVLMLDRDLQVTFMNHRLCETFKAPPLSEIRRLGMSFQTLLEDAARRSTVQLDNLVETRLAWVRAADPTPMDLVACDGTVMRSQVTALPSGARLLIYSDVTDIVNQAKQLQQLAATDELTGLNNRRSFFAGLQKEWQRSRRYGRQLSVVMIDIDLFKQVNDLYGHAVGDAVLVEVGAVLKQTCRGSDLIGRVGGEEFALLLPETDLEQAERAAERYREAVADLRIERDGVCIQTSISLGVATMIGDTATVAELMRQADAALYAAKTGGRNRINVYKAPQRPSRIDADAQPRSLAS